MAEIEERVDNLELSIGRCILESDRAWRRHEKNIAALEGLIRRSDERAEVDRQNVEADRRYWNRRWGELSHQMGTFVEDIISQDCVNDLKKHGIYALARNAETRELLNRESLERMSAATEESC